MKSNVFYKTFSVGINAYTQQEEVFVKEVKFLTSEHHKKSDPTRGPLLCG
ncbi:hypothetical protein [Priestia koreensis]|nr:hypothetical protein [Priestia koreensis]UNL86943.1 hypothetical protein IE339_10830 [Priestia koreensis]